MNMLEYAEEGSRAKGQDVQIMQSLYIARWWNFNGAER